jgi:acetyltransferase-like isoleucine patch superfamily enzyme
MGLADVAGLGLAHYGSDVRIYEWVRLIDPQAIRIGSHVVIDDFVLVQGGVGTEIGDHVHLASFCGLTGGGRTVVGNFAGISSGVRLMSGSDVMDGSGLTGPTVPDQTRSVVRSFVTVGEHAVVGANAVVQPGVSIGEGAIVGSGAVVLSDVEPWTINVGVPSRPVGLRPSHRVLELARDLGYEKA